MLNIDEALITQKTFRLLLQAMSHPGHVYQIENHAEIRYYIPFIHKPKYFKFWALFLVLYTLLDHEVTFTFLGSNHKEWQKLIKRVTGSRLANINEADFIVIFSGKSKGEILHAKRGTLEYPDSGATVIYFIESLRSKYLNRKEDHRVVLKGPGIDGEIVLLVNGIDKNEFYYLREINSEYPLGVDSILVDSEGKIMCIPRSTRIEVK